MLTVKRTEVTNVIAGSELAWRREDVKPKLYQVELARRLTVMTGQIVCQQDISLHERAFEFGVDDEMLAALNKVLG